MADILGPVTDTQKGDRVTELLNEINAIFLSSADDTTIVAHVDPFWQELVADHFPQVAVDPPPEALIAQQAQEQIAGIEEQEAVLDEQEVELERELTPRGKRRQR